MSRTTKPLTNTESKQAKPKEKEFNLNDGDGLALRIKPNGLKYGYLSIIAHTTKSALPSVLELIRLLHWQKPEPSVNLHCNYSRRI
jgi:hypothetical protein